MSSKIKYLYKVFMGHFGPFEIRINRNHYEVIRANDKFSWKLGPVK